MDEGSYQEILTAAGFRCTPASSEFLAWLKGFKTPQEILDLLAAGLPERQKRRRRWRDRWDLHTEGEIQQEAAEFPRYLKAGLLSLGSCANGDPFALDVRKAIGTVGYISHDEVWGDEEARIRQHYVVVAPSLVEFARRARDGRLPIDYYEAKEWKSAKPKRGG